MLTLVLRNEIQLQITRALSDAGIREVGGVLMAEHIGENRFEIKAITVHKSGAIASFIRRIEDALGKLQDFFANTRNHYTKFNYIGEWHSHPLFSLEPSPTDDNSLRQIVGDSSVGANFVVLMIVKLDPQATLLASAHTYLPDGTKARSNVLLMD